jgi:site-specific recombinase XerD
MTFSVFWEDVLGMASVEDGYEWGIEHDETIKSFQSYLQSLRDRRELSDSSIETLRYRLARYARAYSAVNETDDLLTPVARGSDIPPHEAVDTCWDAFDYLHQDLDGGGLKRRIHRAVDNWYAHLVRRKRASINPATGLENEFKWERDGTDNPSLEPGHVMALEETADSTEEHLLIIALCAWGLRPGEVAALHRSQIILNEDSIPYVDFEERKNGPGEVSILFGRTVYEERVIELSDRKQWNGYLFPSSGSSTGHITRQTVLNWFDDMADRAGLPEEINGKKPVPKMGRRFWYDAYSSVLDNILQGMDEVASEQGSKSAEVVLQNYLSNERNRELRREQMRQRLSEAFGSSD